MKDSDQKSWAREAIVGLWAAPLMPFTDDLEIDEQGLRENLALILELDLGGISFSSLMEIWALSHEERRRGLEIFVDAVDGQVPTYATTTSHSVRDTIDFTNHAHAQNVDIAMIHCPYEHMKSQEMAVRFYETVCKEVQIPVAIYNTPHSGETLTIETITKIAAIPNVCAIKNAVDDVGHTWAVREAVGDYIVVSDPFEEHYLNSILLGGQQCLFSATSPFLMQSPQWQPIRDYQEAAQGGDVATAWKIREEISDLRSVWEKMYEPLWRPGRALHPLAETKEWLDFMGLNGGPVRPPLTHVAQPGAIIDALKELPHAEELKYR